jgi:hypothetical protein
MAVFAVFSPPDEVRIDDAIPDVFPNAFYKVAAGQFLVSVNKMTARQIAEKLGAYSAAVGRVLVVRGDSYAGWHSKNLWEWVTTQTDSSTDPSPEASGGPSGG